MEFFTTKSDLSTEQGSTAVPSPQQFCMICLDTDCKLYPLSKYNLDLEFENLTGIALQSEVKFVPQFCTECAQRLKNCGKFREKSLRAYQLLSELFVQNELLTIQKIKSINRKDKQLASNIVKRTFQPDHCDLYLVDHKDHIKKVDVKVEGADLVLELGKARLNYGIKFEEDLLEVELDIDNEGQLSNNDVNVEVGVVDKKELKNDDIPDLEFLDDDVDDDIDHDMNFLDDFDSYGKFVNENVLKKDTESSKNKVISNTKAEKNKSSIPNENKDSFNNIVRDKLDIKNENNQNNVEIAKSKRVTSNKTDKTKITKLKIQRKTKSSRKNTAVSKDTNDEPKKKINLRSAIKDRTDRVKSKTQICSMKLPTDMDTTNERNVIVKRCRKKRIKGPERQPASKDELNFFKVTEVTRDEQLEEIRSRKETANYKVSPYKCTICYKGFVDIDAYDGHMDRHTDKFGPFECSICKIHTKDKHALSKHMIVNHRNKYHCTRCEFVTNYKNTATDHGRWHDGKQYKCPHCEEVFMKQTSYMSHIRIKHPSDFVCNLCGYSFIGERGLKLHMSIKHRADNTQILHGPHCEECDIRFASDTAYEQHMKVSIKHATAEMHCSVFPSKLKPNCPPKKYQLICKKRKRNTPRKVDCEQCGMVLEGGRNYAVHFRIHHPDKNRTKYSVNASKTPIMCELCGKVLPSLSHLRYHMPFHAEQKQFKCDICDKRFAFERNLKNHAVIHNEARPRVECTVCGKNVSNKNNLWRHMFSHKEARPYYKCEVCDKNFASLQGRNEHVLHVHSNVPRPKRNRVPRPNPKVTHHARHTTDTSDSQDS